MMQHFNYLFWGRSFCFHIGIFNLRYVEISGLRDRAKGEEEVGNGHIGEKELLVLPVDK